MMAKGKSHFGVSRLPFATAMGAALVAGCVVENKTERNERSQSTKPPPQARLT